MYRVGGGKERERAKESLHGAEHNWRDAAVIAYKGSVCVRGYNNIMTGDGG